MTGAFRRGDNNRRRFSITAARFSIRDNRIDAAEPRTKDQPSQGTAGH